MSRNESARQQAYRVHFAIGTVAGVDVELSNPAGSGKRIAIRRSLVRVDTNVQCTLKRNTAPCTGGTSTSFTPVPMASDQVSSVATAKIYSAAPTEGASPVSFGRIDLFNGAFYDSGHQSLSEQEQVTLLPGEYLSLVTNTAGVTLTGFIDWTEV